MDQGVNITSFFLYDLQLRADREWRRWRGREGRGKREGEIPPLITSWVTAPAGRCQNPTLSDVRRALQNGRDGAQRERRRKRSESKSIRRRGE